MVNGKNNGWVSITGIGSKTEVSFPIMRKLVNRTKVVVITRVVTITKVARVTRVTSNGPTRVVARAATHNNNSTNTNCRTNREGITKVTKTGRLKGRVGETTRTKVRGKVRVKGKGKVRAMTRREVRVNLTRVAKASLTKAVGEVTSRQPPTTIQHPQWCSTNNNNRTCVERAGVGDAETAGATREPTSGRQVPHRQRCIFPAHL